MISDEDLRAVFDIAVGSMDFGSGFLDSAEVNSLRALAEHIGVDPMEATPGNFRDNYQHKYYSWGDRLVDLETQRLGVRSLSVGREQELRDRASLTYTGGCYHCGRATDWWAHKGEVDGA